MIYFSPMMMSSFLFQEILGSWLKTADTKERQREISEMMVKKVIKIVAVQYTQGITNLV